MPDLHPFAGLRYATEMIGTDIGDLVAPPYDVVDEDLRSALESTHPLNSIRLILPRDAQSEGDRYERAARTLSEWRSSGYLVADRVPRLYGYAMRYVDAHGAERHTIGALGALGLPEAGDESVLPHERTIPKAKSDRLSLLRATRANLDPIWGLSLTEGLSDLIDTSSPLATCLDPEGVQHTLYDIADPDCISSICEAVARTPLVLADGHHRFETALGYRQELRERATPPGGASQILAFVVELAEHELCIEPIHRLVHLPPGFDARAALCAAWAFTDAGPNTPEGVDALEARMASDGGIGLADGAGLALMVPLSARHAVGPVESTDAALVEEVVLPLLPGAQVSFRHDARTCAALVGKGSASAAVLLRPVSVATTRAAAQARLRMPQKTTFFRPKPRTGFVFRSLDG